MPRSHTHRRTSNRQRLAEKNRRLERLRFRALFVEPLEDRTLLDSTGPRVLSVSPTEVRNAVFDHVDVVFNEAIDSGTFTAADVALTGPVGNVAVTDVTPLATDTVRMHFDALTARGTYRLSVGPEIADLAGNLMDQNQNGTKGEATADRYTAAAAYISANAVFSTATTISETNTTYNGRDLLIDGVTVTIDGPHNFNSVHVINGGVLTHSANTSTQTHDLDLIVVEQVIVDGLSRVDVSGKGYLSGRTTGNTTAGGVSGSGTGASHGGVARPTGGRTNAVYGDYTNPDDWGSGGNSGAGGGLVRITAGAIQLDGQVAADGVATAGGSGSGGSVYLSTDALRGAGSIRADANGGDGGAGGGRVAVYAADVSGFDTTRITAGGYSAGTVYLRDTDEAGGTLVMDNAAAGGRIGVDERVGLAAEGVEALAEEAAVGAGAAEGEAPAEVSRQSGVVGQVGAGGLEELDDGAHARGVGVAGDGLVDVHGLFAAGEADEGVVAAGVVVDRADEGAAAHPAGGAGQVLADLGAGDGRGDGLELAADLGGGVGFEVEHVLGGGAAVEVDDQDVAGAGGPGGGRAAFLAGEQVGQVQAAAEDGESAGGEGLASGEAVAEAAAVAEDAEQGGASWGAGRGGQAGVRGARAGAAGDRLEGG